MIVWRLDLHPRTICWPFSSAFAFTLSVWQPTLKKSFYQIGLHEQDRDFVRFLWLKNPLNPKSDFESFHFRVISFGASSSPFILLSVIKKHLQASSSPLAVDINQNVYVDNLISGCETSEEAMYYFSEGNNVLKEAGLKLQSWGSNDSHLATKATATAKESAMDLYSPKSLDSIGIEMETLFTSLMSSSHIYAIHSQRNEKCYVASRLCMNHSVLSFIYKTIENTTISFPRPYLAKGKALELHLFVDARLLVGLSDRTVLDQQDGKDQVPIRT